MRSLGRENAPRDCEAVFTHEGSLFDIANLKPIAWRAGHRRLSTFAAPPSVRNHCPQPQFVAGAKQTETTP